MDNNRREFRILHISDLHFGMRSSGSGGSKSVHHFIRKRKGGVAPDPERLANILAADESFQDEGPDVIIASGDIGWSGIDADYEPAAEFFKLIKKKWKNARLVIVPGNHDVDLTPGLDSEERQQAFVRFLELVNKPRSLADDFPFLNGDEDPNLSKRARLTSLLTVDKTASIVGLNSAAHLDKERGPVFIPADLMERIAEKLAEGDDTSLRILVMHHHLLPFAEPAWGETIDYSEVGRETDPTTVANSGQLQAWMARNDFGLVLHGHKHMPHGRQDILWRREDSDVDRRVLVLGAGSAGVEERQLPRGERLSFNVVHLSRIGRRRWEVATTVRRINPDDPGKRTESTYDYKAQVGPVPRTLPATFCAEDSIDCHRAIFNATRHTRELHNFVSIVEDSKYRHPENTAKLGDQPAGLEDVENSFYVLHPEYHKEYEWGDQAEVQSKLENLRPRFRFQHGPRLFSTPGRYDTSGAQPVRKALDLVETKTRAFVSLVNTSIDLLADRPDQPFPALTSVQFIPRDDHLDLVATFRAIELSFWWCVNMYELSKLIQWAAREKHSKPGHITIFSPVAIWKNDATPSLVTELDDKTIVFIHELLLDAMKGQKAKLIGVLEQKRQQTNQFNLDASGIRRMIQLMKAISSGNEGKDAKWLHGLCNCLEKAEEEIATALKRPDSRITRARRACDHLEEAIGLLKVDGSGTKKQSGAKKQ